METHESRAEVGEMSSASSPGYMKGSGLNQLSGKSAHLKMGLLILMGAVPGFQKPLDASLYPSGHKHCQTGP